MLVPTQTFRPAVRTGSPKGRRVALGCTNSFRRHPQIDTHTYTHTHTRKSFRAFRSLARRLITELHLPMPLRSIHTQPHSNPPTSTDVFAVRKVACAMGFLGALSSLSAAAATPAEAQQTAHGTVELRSSCAYGREVLALAHGKLCLLKYY